MHRTYHSLDGISKFSLCIIKIEQIFHLTSTETIMPLRNGKEYLIPHRCQKCRRFYSHAIFNYTCSSCAGAAPLPPATEQSPELLEWVKKNTVDRSVPSNNAFLIQLQRMDTERLFVILGLLRHHRRVLLKAEDALTLLEYNNSVARGHVVATAVADWWNIKTRDVDGNWPAYLVCYYGNFDNKFPPRKLPPRPPRMLLSCSNTTHLLNLIPTMYLI